MKCFLKPTSDDETPADIENRLNPDSPRRLKAKREAEKRRGRKIRQQQPAEHGGGGVTGLDLLWKQLGDHFSEHVRALGELARRQGLSLSPGHCEDILADAIRRKPMTFVSLYRCLPSRELLGNILSATDPALLEVVTNEWLIAHYGSAALATRAISKFGFDELRRLRVAGRLPSDKALEPRARTSEADNLGVPHGNGSKHRGALNSN